MSFFTVISVVSFIVGFIFGRIEQETMGCVILILGSNFLCSWGSFLLGIKNEKDRRKRMFDGEKR